jgi:hypothetical protein
MPVTMEFKEGGRICHLVMSDPWTVTELTSQYPNARQIYDAATSPIHILLELNTKTGTWKGARGGILETRTAPGLTHPMAGNVAVIGANSFMRRSVEAVFRIIHFRRVQFFENEAKAMDYLHGLLRAEDVAKTTK